ncbi:hemerythrin domain-containing protein [Mesorhizobium qingshengii]|uniref:Hemerythrin domain-containing protein n=1 Tax=Mesorhizobium qingshengii TaxID=1165689 RepID=A0ABT4R3E7_9HYPH|nr:hemerythrin domain-containing protein [Mesorhizobium qingshengii]MCZ8548345.1 hemerythrin domain-containing protein [Mesorhizobium qingshengii]
MLAEIPTTLKIEHDELHAELVKATKAGGRTGEAANAVARVLHDHFVKEEDYALPPLGILKKLAHGTVQPEMAEVLQMTDRLEAELGTMLAEHESIVAELGKLKDAASVEGRPDVVRFAEKLMLHARTEEEVLYPAAILIGRYLKLMLAG